MSRRRSSKHNTAAYAASQPLLDAITYGKNKVAQQKENLSKASDIVRNIHVQLPSVTGAQAAEDHNRSLDAIVAAWRNATEAYTEIFDSLAEITAADPSLGREATKGHDDFKSMASSARTANKVANEWVSAVETSIPVRTSSRPTSQEVEDEMDVDDSKYAETVAQTASNSTQVNGSEALLLEKERQKAVLHQKREKKRAAHREKVADLKAKKAKAAAKPGVNGMVEEDVGGVKLPTVEYEDVSAEVEARLKAKEEKKKSQKAEKKRKRGSGDSVTLLEEAIRDADKPRKKKVRPSAAASEQGAAGDKASSQDTGKKSKRRVVNGGIEVAEGSKKRKKTR